MFILNQLMKICTFIINIYNIIIDNTEKIVDETKFDITKIDQDEIPWAYENDELYYGIISYNHFYDGLNGYDN